MTADKITIRMDGQNILTFENCSGEKPATINVPSSTETLVTEGVRKVVSEYGEALRKLSNE